MIEQEAVLSLWKNNFFRKEYYTTRTVPRLACSTKLSPVRRSQYLDGWPNTNTPKYISCFSFLFSFFPFPFQGNIKACRAPSIVECCFFYTCISTVCSSFHPVHIYLYLFTPENFIDRSLRYRFWMTGTHSRVWGSAGRWRETRECFA